MIPRIDLYGTFVVDTPFTVKPDMNYRVIAVRSFNDIYRKDEDVYTKYYTPYGLINGQAVNGIIFNFDKELKDDVKIVSLKSDDGTLLYIPSSYIRSLPNVTNVPYSQVILGVDLGPLPDDFSTDLLAKTLTDQILSHFGIVSNVQVARQTLLTFPTPDQAIQQEQARLAAIANNPDQAAIIEQLNLKLQAANTTNETLVKILRDNKLI